MGTLGQTTERAERRRRPRVAGVLAAGLAWLALAPGAGAQSITPNYKDADLRQIIEAVSEVTNKNFIVDPRVKAQVTMLSATPMTAEAFYETFLSILDVYGYIAVESGNVIKILPDANARQSATPGLTASGDPRDQIVTQVVKVRNVGAAQLVPIMRPLIPQYGHLAAHTASNMLIVSDRAANVNRLVSIISRIDREGESDVDVIQLQEASAGDVVRTVTALNQAAARGEGGAAAVGLVADQRTNSVLVSGDQERRLRVRALIMHLDTPLETGGNTQVIYLRYADAEELAGKLREQVAQTTAAQGGAQGGAAGGRPRDDIIIWADTPTNALVITAPPETMRMLRSVIDQIDIRRAQVLVEAIVAEVSYDKAAELGVSWAIDGTDDGNIVGLTSFTSALNVVDVASGLASGEDDDLGSTLAAIPDGMTLAGGRFGDSGTNWAVILRALLADANTNVLATPSIVTLDNEEAEIKVGEEVPFVTGQFTNTGAAQGSVNPFQTIQREDVGLRLKITPQINEGNAIILDVDLENSTLGSAAQQGGAVDLITQERTITQRVLIEDGQLLVLGGLVNDQILEIDEKVPILGDIPLIDNFFKSRSSVVSKRTLMVFIRPVIMRDLATANVETNDKYEMMRRVQLGRSQDGKVLLQRQTQRPVMQPYGEWATGGADVQAEPASQEGAENAPKEGAEDPPKEGAEDPPRENGASGMTPDPDAIAPPSIFHKRK